MQDKNSEYVYQVKLHKYDLSNRILMQKVHSETLDKDEVESLTNHMKMRVLEFPAHRDSTESNKNESFSYEHSSQIKTCRLKS